jgi:protein SCO1/2
VTQTVHDLQSSLDLAHQPDLRLVTFTMDPEHDTPDVLKKYAENPLRPAKSDRWLFLTGPEDQVRGLMRNTFKLAFEQNRDPATPPGRKYDHGTFVFVVDKKGQVRGHFDGLQGASDETGERYRDNCARLAAKVKELLAE